MGACRIALLAALLPSLITCPLKQPSLQVVREQIEEGQALLIDVRSTQEWVDGHVTFALHFPITEIEAGKLPINLPKDKILYVHCKQGRRSAKAAALLKEEYPCVVSLTYNITQFKAAGFPTT